MNKKQLNIAFLALWAISTTTYVLSYLNNKSIQDEYSRRLRGERDMYEKLFRTANTKLMNFQDSINIHCICK